MLTANFSQAFQQVRKPLWAYAVTLTKSTRTAAVLVRETESRAALEFSRSISPLNFKAWIFAMLRNVYLARYRRELSPVPRKGNAEGFGSTSSRPRLLPVTHEDSSLPHVSHANLRLYLDKLDPIYSRPFTMYYTGYSYDEIAGHLKLPLATVKARVIWARQQLMLLIRQRDRTYA